MLTTAQYLLKISRKKGPTFIILFKDIAAGMNMLLLGLDPFKITLGGL